MNTFSSFMDQLKKETKKTHSQVTALERIGSPYYRKFEMVSQFAMSIRDVLAISDHSCFGASFIWYHTIRHIMQYAFNDIPVPGINYEKVLISRGRLWNTQKATATAVSNAINFTWTNDTGVGYAKPDDRCILVAYCEALNKCVFTKEGGERRFGEAKLMVPGFRSQKVHTWLGFISTDGTRIANSLYTGELTIT